MHGHSIRSWVWAVTHRLLVLVTLLVMLFPIYYLVLTSLTTADQIVSQETSVFMPQHLSLAGYRAVLSNPNLVRYVVNSMVVAGIVTILSVTMSALGAYSLARLPFPGS